ncbi:MAG: redoxin domain-containing protein, partial [Actinobacteria bacterium]
MRRSYDEIKRHGAELVAIGTGDARYARAFTDDEDIPFPVLLDEDGEAARAASVKRGSVLDLVGPRTVAGAAKAVAAGHRQHKTGKRGSQLGATFVLGPGDVVRYEHLDGDVS